MNASVMPTEILKLVMSLFTFLQVDELQDIGMVHPQDAHVGPRPGAALLHGLGSHIEHARIKLTGPEATPPVGLTGAPFCRRRENESPCRRRICG